MLFVLMLLHVLQRVISGIHTLQKTLFYRDFANETLALLDNEEAIAKHPEYGYLRRMSYDKDFYFSDQITPQMLQDLYTSNTDNRIAYEYMMASDLQVYDVSKNELLLSPILRQDSIYETYPVFSADGHSIYFCAARALPQGSQQLDSIRYNLCRIDFDPATGNFGTHIDTIINAEAQHKSVSFPRPSYDGKFLCYTLSD
ncbi:MAG: DUF6057 family protein [Bacteroidaceae bacterium]|nr:DUF6057 family protein [Bacteroidaceae bacterium]